METWLKSASVGELVDRALELDDDDRLYWDIVGELQLRGDATVFDAMAFLCTGPMDARKRLGLDVLAQLGHKKGRPFLEESLPIVTALCDPVESVSVLESAISALGLLYEPRAVSTICGFAGYDDPDVRLAVAIALPPAAGDPPDSVAVEALLTLMQDPSEDVRDWATFGIGTLLEAVDSRDIRQALWERVDDPDGDTAGEALLGLAARGDRAVIDHLERRLRDPGVGNLIVEAAGRIPNRRFLDPLQALEAAGWADEGPRGGLLATAIRSCQSANGELKEPTV